MRTLCLLGASGNIGRQSLDILSVDRESFSLVGFSVGKQADKIPSILQEFPSVKSVYLIDEIQAGVLQKQYPHVHFHSGKDGLKTLISESNAEMVENALVGFSGLVPSIHALSENRILALANKESLVVGGKLIKALLASGKGSLYPIDSEHVALAKCLSKVNKNDVDRLLITASGGSFRDYPRDQLRNVTAEDALRHPTWNMGKKITIDSATMMNKGFEVIEASWLFDWPIEKVDILLHKESHVHSLLLMKDGTYWADVSKPDMHGPIEYALYEGKKPFEVYHEKTLEDFGPYSFKSFDSERYPAVSIALSAFKRGGNAPAILNASNEESDYLFLDGKIPFLAIEEAVESALSDIPFIENPSLEDLLATDSKTREYIRRKYHDVK